METAMKINKLPKSLSSRTGIGSGSRVKITRKKSIQKKRHGPRRCICFGDSEVVEFPKAWNELRQNQQLCDGRLHSCDGKTFNIHRAILCAVSPYFKTLFTNSLKCSRPEVKEFTLEEVPADILKCLLDYAYTGHCHITAANIERLLPLADQYDIVGVVQQCCQFLLKHTRPDSCLNIFKFARDFFCTKLQQKAWLYIMYNFKAILDESSEFEDLNLKEVVQILSNDLLNVRSEHLVFEAAIKWLSKEEDRQQHTFDLLNCVRFGQLSQTYFKEHILTNEYIINCPEMSVTELLGTADKLLEEIVSHHSTRRDLEHLNMYMAKPRIPYEVLFTIGGWSSGTPTNFMESYDTRADRWFLSEDADTAPRAYHGLVELDNLIYVIGGFNGSEYFNTMRCFDPTKRHWTEKACMYHARCYVSVCTLAGEIYAMGGYNGHTRTNSAERYTPHLNQWQMISPMNKQRSDASAATLNSKIYIVGGFNGAEVLSSAEMYDPRSRQWTSIGNMRSARSGVSLVAHRNSLYALGGFNGFVRLPTAERLDPVFPYTWVEITEMFHPRSNFATAIVDDMIFVIGGFNGMTTIPFTECYDLDLKEWYTANSMNLNRSALGACVCRGLSNTRDFTHLTLADSPKSLAHERSGDGIDSGNTGDARSQDSSMSRSTKWSAMPQRSMKATRQALSLDGDAGVPGAKLSIWIKSMQRTNDPTSQNAMPVFLNVQ